MRRKLADDLTMVTLDELREQLGDWVNDDALRKWSTRYGMHRIELDGVWWYHLEDAIEIEFLTAGKGRPRSGAAEAAA